MLPGLNQRQVLLRHRRLRLRQARVLRKRRRAACHPGRVHPGRRRRTRFLRCKPCRRLQRADAGGAAGWLRREVQRDGVRRGPERRVSLRAEGDEWRWERGSGGVQERVRGV